MGEEPNLYARSCRTPTVVDVFAVHNKIFIEETDPVQDITRNRKASTKGIINTIAIFRLS